MKRRNFISLAAASATLGIGPSARGFVRSAAPDATNDLPLEELTIDQIQSSFASGRVTAQSLTYSYLERIRALDAKTVNAVIEVNPEALAMAAALDTERKAKGPRGPMHGVPVLIKDNIDTADKMMTTAGSLSLDGSIAAQDSAVAARLRQAGAVILGKTNLSEWANFRSNHSISGWSGRGGQTRNPFALDRNPSGSSAGTGAGISANFAAVGVGTETDGSIVSPSSCNGLVGIKPTIGLIARSGIIPISHTQDTAGPMTRTVRDAAILLSALAGPDARDPASATAAAHIEADYAKFLDAGGLRGARLGIARKFFGQSPLGDRIIEEAIAVLKQGGAVIIDPADLPSHGKIGDAEFEVLLCEFKYGLNKYLQTTASTNQVRTLTDLIAFNKANASRELSYFEQDVLETADKKGPLTDKAYLDALEKCRKLSRDEGIDAALQQNKLDAIVAMTNGPACYIDTVNRDYDTGGCSQPAAVAGYPHITVPAGYARGLPVGISFFGSAWSEPSLIRFAYAFEQATKVRKAPVFASTVTA
jgi:amidase